MGKMSARGTQEFVPVIMLVAHGFYGLTIPMTQK